MLDDIVGNYGSRLFLAAGGVGLALLVLVGVLWVLRNRAPSPFVRGGKNRQPRLQVLDAAAVDARRRLVLVRRDGVEHLIMIGGPTDIVIESGIGDTSKAAAAPQPLALETQSTPEQRIPQRLEPQREPQRVIARQPAVEQQLPPPPARTAIEPPLAPLPEKRPTPPPVASAPPVVTPPPAVAIVTPPPRPAAIVTPPPPVERPQTAPPVLAALPPEPPSTPPVVESKEVAAAVDILEAARQRVMPPQPPEQPQKASEPPRPPVAVPQTPILVQDAYREASIDSAVIEPEDVPSVAPPKPVGGDFESVLEAEMNSNLVAQRVVTPPPSPAPQHPAPTERRDPELIGVVDRDSALQDEVARIFGEISVKRDT